ncbi:MAG: hypothetical protein JWQ68_1169 [Cryobacterium sp.]|nr:hypothetical protein [Cryobacterium sp.]
MKASPAEQKELLRLQALDNKAQQLEHQAKSLEQHSELMALSGRADVMGGTHTTRMGDLEDARTELRRIESDVDVVEKRIARDEDRVQHTSSVKDVQALSTELAALKKRLFDLEEIEIAVMERVEAAEAAVAEVRSDRETLQLTIRETEQQRDTRLGELTRSLGELHRDRDAVAAAVSPELGALYEKRKIANRGNAAALLRARTCSGCTMTLTGRDLESVRQAPEDDVVFCPDCGAILVRTEESGI